MSPDVTLAREKKLLEGEGGAEDREQDQGHPTPGKIVAPTFDKKALNDTLLQAFKFYMEQHVENIMKTSEDRRRRRQQLEKEMMR